jgi:hypothetical protein
LRTSGLLTTKIFRGALCADNVKRSVPTNLYERRKQINLVEVTKALAALQPLYGKDNVEIVTENGAHVRGVVRSMKTTQALTTPSVKMERSGGEIVKIRFSDITEIINHNPASDGAAG